MDDWLIFSNLQKSQNQNNPCDALSLVRESLQKVQIRKLNQFQINFTIQGIKMATRRATRRTVGPASVMGKSNTWILILFD